MTQRLANSFDHESDAYEAALRSKSARQDAIRRILNYRRACDERAKLLKVKNEETDNENAENSTS